MSEIFRIYTIKYITYLLFIRAHVEPIVSNLVIIFKTVVLLSVIVVLT